MPRGSSGPVLPHIHFLTPPLQNHWIFPALIFPVSREWVIPEEKCSINPNSKPGSCCVCAAGSRAWSRNWESPGPTWIKIFFFSHSSWITRILQEERNVCILAFRLEPLSVDTFEYRGRDCARIPCGKRRNSARSHYPYSLHSSQGN